ncbi:hypothetical protein GCM10009740_39590 [Terrabacter terrae]|uniref:DUF3800 domain-containing protein n=1 Tax=Terrabacter terrae TaxID=318434 RepID=A0ABN1ZU39_9MICO
MPSSARVPASTTLEVACDESGSEGEKLVGGSTDTFAHASVAVSTAVAEETIARVRVEARSPATEVKASVVLRPQNRRVLEWLLGDRGPLLGHSHVHLTDKALHLTGRMLWLLRDGARDGMGGGVDGDGDARGLHREAARRVGREAWVSVLAAFNDVVRARSLEEASAGASLLACRLSEVGGQLDRSLPAEGWSVPLDPEGLLRLVARGRGALDPIVPALADTLRHWGSPGRPFRVVHDVQASLTEAAVRAAVTGSGAEASGAFRGLHFVDSHADPRVQLADFLAGAVRRIASQVLAGDADPTLVTLVTPYLSDRSVWLGPWPAGTGATSLPRVAGR